jgi:hypothetical protein
MLYSFFWAIPRLLNFMCRRSGTLSHLQCKQEFLLTPILGMGKDFCLHIVPRTLSPDVKWLGREADHSPASSAQVQVKCLSAWCTNNLVYDFIVSTVKTSHHSVHQCTFLVSPMVGLRNKAKGSDQTRLIITSSVHCKTTVDSQACLPV